MTRKAILTVSGIAAGILTLAAASFAVSYYLTFKKSNVHSDTELYIGREYTYDSLIDTLKARDIIINWKRFDRAQKKLGLINFKTGHYCITSGMSNTNLVRTLVFGWQTPIQFKFRGYTKTMPRLCGTFAKSFEADSAEFAEVFLNTSIMDSLGFTKETFIGMFIPNTYEMYWTSSPKNVLIRMKKEYDSFWNADRCSRAEAMNFSRSQVMTLASIVTGETNYVPEMPTIAGVYMNRLHKGMKLQACPTVIYAHLETEPGIRRVLSRHLTIDSPYNTYKYAGLPPGPICVPTIAAIDAVLNYENTTYLYFAAKPEFNGTHNFATTYSQHLKNGQAYAKAYSAREKAKKASMKQTDNK